VWLLVGEKSLVMFSRIDTIPACDGKTDSVHGCILYTVSQTRIMHVVLIAVTSMFVCIIRYA